MKREWSVVSCGVSSGSSGRAREGEGEVDRTYRGVIVDPDIAVLALPLLC